MPNSDLVVSDTSPLLNLALIDRLELLEAQFESITAPEVVWEELMAGEAGVSEVRELRNRGTLSLVQVERDSFYVELVRQLDEGEAAAITYAVDNDASQLLLDEREGRKAARRHEIPVTGVVGVLMRAAMQGTVEIETELDRLQEAGFWLSDELYREAVRRVNDST